MVTKVSHPAFFDREVIRDHLSATVTTHLHDLSVVDELPSTNQALLDAPISAGQLWVCLAEHQTAGRGRRGRRWVAPPRSGLCLSIGYGFPSLPNQLSALTLAMGVTTAEVLQHAGAKEVQLKWPNDLVWRGRKLGGILTELAGDGQRPPTVVVGIGVNLALPPEGLVLDGPGGNSPIDLASISDESPSPSLLAAELINTLSATLLSYCDEGFAPFRTRFAGLDALNGEAVEVSVADAKLQGIARGITPDGLLNVETQDSVITVMAGDVVQLRPVV